ncbi:MAG TPA: hypothetical protein VFM18_18600 [Methanosarcina sp.]|nr:hypothetical protein [Methanosarcina sp.]
MDPKFFRKYSDLISENTRGISATVEYRDDKFIVFHSVDLGGYTARGKGKYQSKIAPTVFQTLDDAIEHAQLEIDGYEGQLDEFGPPPDRMSSMSSGPRAPSDEEVRAGLRKIANESLNVYHTATALIKSGRGEFTRLGAYSKEDLDSALSLINQALDILEQ